MDVLDEEILKLWTAFKEYKLQYILVGGFATNLNGFARTTADMDIWIEDTHENRTALINALEHIGLVDMSALATMQFIPGWSSINLLSGYELDIMTDLKGLAQDRFVECYKFAPTAMIFDIPIKFLHINHLIEAKKASNRPKDQIDLLELERIRSES